MTGSGSQITEKGLKHFVGMISAAVYKLDLVTPPTLPLRAVFRENLEDALNQTRQLAAALELSEADLTCIETLHRGLVENLDYLERLPERGDLH